MGRWIDLFKRIISFFIILILTIPFLEINTYAYSAKSYCLYDPVLNKVLASENMHEKRAMASTTKIMTALIACEITNSNDVVTVTDEMIAVEGSSIGLQVGDKISYECLLYGLMLESGNDAALCIAVSISGSAKDFAVLMNQKAKKLGLKNTNFVTPNGLDDEVHYSTAYDMALLGGCAMTNPLFKTIVGTKTYKAVYNNGETFRTYYNHNRLLSSLSGANGIKTGFTRKAGRCLVSSCERYGVRLIAVTLSDGNDWNDHKALYDYGFKQYQEVTLPKVQKYVKVVGSKTNEIVVRSNEKNIYFYDGLWSFIKKKVYLPKFIYAPVNEGEKVGKVEYYYNGTVIATADIVATKPVSAIKTEVKQNKLKKIFKNIILLFSVI